MDYPHFNKEFRELPSCQEMILSLKEYMGSLPLVAKLLKMTYSYLYLVQRIDRKLNYQFYRHLVIAFIASHYLSPQELTDYMADII